MIKWGIIGAGNIANRFANSLEEVTDGELHAVANRTIEKAETFKANHPCEKAYGLTKNYWTTTRWTRSTLPYRINTIWNGS